MKKIINTDKALETFKGYIQRTGKLEEAKELFEKLQEHKTFPSLLFIKQNLLSVDNNIFICNFNTIKNLKTRFKKDKDYNTFFNQYRNEDKKEINNAVNKNKAFDELITFFLQSYDDFVNAKMPYEIMTDLGVRACPYCNLNYIDAVITDDDRNYGANQRKEKISNKNKILRHHLDHYFPKSEYPFFALSFYNLIPSCYECNSPLKGNETKIFPLNPYIEDYDNMAKFEIKYNEKPEHIKFSDIKNLNDFEITIKIKDKSFENKIISHNELFKLEARYKYRKDYVLEVLRKKDFFTDDMIKEISRRSHKSKYSKDYVNSIIWGDYINSKSINKRPLSKLTKDILEQRIITQEKANQT